MDALTQFFAAVWVGLRDPATLLQLATIVACTLLGWSGAKILRRMFSTNPQPPGVGSFARVLTPLLTLLLISVARQLWFTGWYQHGNLLRIVVPLVASLALMRFGFYLVRRIFAHQRRVDNTLTMMEKLFAVVVWSGGLLYISGLWPDLLQFLDTTRLPLGHNKVSLTTILETVATVLVALTLALWAGALLEQRLMQMDVVNVSLRAVLARTGRAVLILIGLLASLAFVGIDLTVLSVFGGALGVGIGLGMQKIASNYVSGFVILLDGSLKIGDMITVDKYVGKVTQINARYTVLQGLDGVESVLPNELLVSGPVQNFSLSSSSVRVATRLTLPYGCDMDFLFPLIEKETGQVARVLSDPPSNCSLIKVSGDGLEVEIGFWINDPENGRGGVISDVNRAICRVLQQQDVVLEPSHFAVTMRNSGNSRQ